MYPTRPPAAPCLAPGLRFRPNPPPPPLFASLRLRPRRPRRGRLRDIMNCVLNSLEAVVELLALFALILFIFALLGVQLMGLKFTPEAGFDEVPRTNFDSTAEAMLTVFVVMSGENWNDVWSSSKKAVGSWCASYYVFMVIMGNYVLLNLFVAILLSGLEADDDDDVRRPPPTPRRPGARLRRHMKARSPAAVGAGHSRWPTPPTPPTATTTPARPPAVRSGRGSSGWRTQNGTGRGSRTTRRTRATRRRRATSAG